MKPLSLKSTALTTLLALGLTLAPALAAAPEIYIAYPDNDYEVGFDHVLFEGSVPAGASFSIDGKSIDVGKDGLFIEWLPLKPGLNTLKLESSLNGETTTKELKVTSSIDAPLPESPTLISKGSVGPSNEMIYYRNEGQSFTVSFRGSPNGAASFMVGDKGPFKMAERKPENFLGLGDPKSLAAIGATAGLYEGSFTAPVGATFDKAEIKVMLTGPDKQTMTASAPAKLTVMNMAQPVVGFYTYKLDIGLIGSAQVGRNAPGRAYVIWPREGMKFQVTGEEGTTYQVKLSPSQYAYIRKTSMKLLAEGTPAPKNFFTTIRTARVEGATQVRFFLPDMAPYTIDQTVNKYESSLTLRLLNTYSDVDYMVFANPDPNIRDIKWLQEDEGVFKAVIDLKNAAQWGYRTFYQGNTFVVEIKDAPNVSRTKPLMGRTVTIDPGHGGEDSGAVGALKLNEKDFNLKISLSVADKLKAMGAKVVMTRSTDVEIGLFDRSVIAHDSKSDIFVSIHGNALPDGVDPNTQKGFGAYYFQPQSRELAQAIHDTYLKLVPEIGNDGVHYQNLAVTRPFAIPQVLLETGFLTNKDNLRTLMSETGRERIANGIAKGIEEFFARAAKRKVL
jgi:N-acetylmuramoyl-L-alanine amidase